MAASSKPAWKSVTVEHSALVSFLQKVTQWSLAKITSTCQNSLLSSKLYINVFFPWKCSDKKALRGLGEGARQPAIIHYIWNILQLNSFKISAISYLPNFFICDYFVTLTFSFFIISSILLQDIHHVPEPQIDFHWFELHQSMPCIFSKYPCSRGERTVEKTHKRTQTILSKKARTRTNTNEQVCILKKLVSRFYFNKKFPSIFLHFPIDCNPLFYPLFDLFIVLFSHGQRR